MPEGQSCNFRLSFQKDHALFVSTFENLRLQEVGFSSDLILLNAGAYTHTSVAIGDAIKSINTSVIEIHISNTFAREDFRHISYITPVAKGLIIGFDLDSYRLGVESALK